MIGFIIIAIFLLVFILELTDVKKEKEHRFGVKSNRWR